MIEFDGVGRTYRTGQREVIALRDVCFRVEPGEWVALVGPSGSGKSTLLNLIAGLDRATTGTAVVAGRDLSRLGEESLAAWRARHVGIVFQFFQLLPTLTARENVVLPMEFAGRKGNRARRAIELLEAVGLAELADRLPGELSGGEQQRVAIARALANEPSLLVADEPTGNLDAASGEGVIEHLRRYWSEGGTVVLVTHDPAIAAGAPRVLTLADGSIQADTSQADTKAPIAVETDVEVALR
jgi:putative ABC transport system ATP-binding protein